MYIKQKKYMYLSLNGEKGGKSVMLEIQILGVSTP